MGAEPDNDELREAPTGPVSPRSPREMIQPEAVPAPPPPSRLARHPVVVFVNGIFTFIVLIVIVGLGVLYWGHQRFSAEGPLSEPRSVIVPRGADARSIANLLERNGIIENKWIFFGGLVAHKTQTKLKAGEYIFEANVSMAKVMDTLVEGRAILHTVTIPEGLTSTQVVERLNASDVLVGTIAEIPEEGSLLPDTYKFTRGTDRNQILNWMRSAHERVVRNAWARRADGLPIATPRELVILASIVEKETGKADERPRVASVFINRLRRNMRLQSDPTIIYGLVGGEGKLGRGLRRSEIDKETPYNTYQIDGLPPGPIANPGRAAIEAVANPSRTDDLFFVADGTGGHVFASTYQEHQRNVNRWRKIEREEKAEAERKAAEEAPAADGAVAAPAGAPNTFGGLIEPNVEASDGAVVRELEGEIRGDIKAVPLDPLRGGLDLRLPR